MDDSNVKRTKVPPELQKKANIFLNAKELDTKVLKELVEALKSEDVNSSGAMYVLEIVFKNLVKRKCLAEKCNENDDSQSKAKCYLLYEETWVLLLEHLASSNKEECSVAVDVCMQLIAAEGQHPIISHKSWPEYRLKSILNKFINSEMIPPAGLVNFNKYLCYSDVLETTCKILPDVTPTNFSETPSCALNYLAIVSKLDLSKNVLNAEQQLVKSNTNSKVCTYESLRSKLNKIWRSILSSSNNIDEKIHRQVLVVLLERILPHLNKPILLTDFLMDSLHKFDGAIALLALQGIFTLMQQQNITYPDVYTKLYNMFYSRMFHNKYKARLFYLADIFLTSTHLPENLVAAFIKRLARLALTSPTEDAIILIRFICNLMLRHSSLQRLLCASPSQSGVELIDPYDEYELVPTKSQAINSSLWELVMLQKHAVPKVAHEARLFCNGMPAQEFDLGPLLELKECDTFDEEIQKNSKTFALSFERPTNLAIPKEDIITNFWDLV